MIARRTLHYLGVKTWATRRNIEATRILLLVYNANLFFQRNCYNQYFKHIDMVHVGD